MLSVRVQSNFNILTRKQLTIKVFFWFYAGSLTAVSLAEIQPKKPSKNCF